MPRVIDDELRPLLAATAALIPAVSRDLRNPPWEGASARILILRLSPLDDIAGSTSHLVLFSECRRALPGAFIDFGFFPGQRDRSILAARGLPFFYGLDSGRSASDFGLVLVSNSFALELINLPYLFSEPGLPGRASVRATSPTSPIVLLGGSNAGCAGALLLPGEGPEEEADSLVDGIFFGEGEGALGELSWALTLEGATRAERLAAASGIAGLWTAGSGRRASRKTVLPYPPQLLAYPVLNTRGASTAKLQISAGCPGFCSFCLEGWESRPYRELPVAEIAAAARELKAASGASSLEVYSYNFNTHSSVFDLVFELSRIFRHVNFMSQRLDILSESPALVAAELVADKKSFTLGIEGISERMRAFYRKGVDETQIETAAARLALPAVRELKLFYIIAGIEDDRDIAEFSETIARVAELRRARAPSQRILASVGYLVRLPFTPLQYAGLCLDRDRLEGLARRIEGACASAGVEFRLAADFQEYYVDQLLALGGRRLSPWLERCPAEGLVYDGGLARGTGRSLEAFAARAGILGPDFEAEKGEAWRPPLAFVDENHTVLHRQYRLASDFAPRGASLAVPASQGASQQDRLARLMEAKRRFEPLFVRLSFPKELAGATEEYRASWLLRRVYAASAEARASLFDAEDALFGAGGRLEGLVEGYWGCGLYRLLGPDPARLAKAAKAAGLETLERDPGTPVGTELELELPLGLARAAEESIKAWLAEERIKYLEEREGGGRMLLPIQREERKKMLVSAHLKSDEAAGLFTLSLSLGPKARLAPWLAKLAPAASLAAPRIVGLSFPKNL